ncbi:MAG: NAD-dependent epimerase/dehydratase family protein [Chloroflexi bacterium]|nr:NAD-dependent epimerase/dehydratase family protein [Chloroflexota bacterium]
MRVLIIGGTGLISTAITARLLARGDDVWLYNRAQTTRYAPVPSAAHVIVGDRQQYATFEHQLADAGHFDCVVDMIGYLPAEVESAVRVLRGRTEQYIFCSTIDVYQKPASRYPYTEGEPYGGLNAYSSNKVTCERLLWAAYERGDLPVTIIRPAYTYGEGRGPICSWGLSPTYLDRVRRGKPLVVHGDGSSFWTVCHRDDVAQAFVSAAGRTHTLGRSYHTPGEVWMTWNQYHQLVAGALGAPQPELVHIPTDVLVRAAPARGRLVGENFQFSNIFDTTAARRDLDFADRMPWIEGVQRMTRWLDTHGGIEDSDQDPFDDQLVAAWRRHGTALAADTALLDGEGA